MIKLANVAMSLDDEEATRGGVMRTSGALVEAVARQIGMPAQVVCGAEVVRRSLDARKKSAVHFVVSIVAELDSAEREQQVVATGRAQAYVPPTPLKIAPLSFDVEPGERPLVVGAGPAGLFCALFLARAGARPVLIERGAAVEERVAAVEAFNAGGDLNLRANAQFGEGGAGTFSDGKLNTGTKHAYTAYVLDWFAEAGAPADILWEAKPHIGSDKLPAVVRTLREQIIAAGGEVRFNTQLMGLRIEDSHVVGATLRTVDGASEQLAVSRVVLAIGHSARDTYEMLQMMGLRLERKPFAMGVRIEHAQEAINRALWGPAADHPVLRDRAGDYKMAVHVDDKRSAYTFCMCPGGTVVAAASELGGVVTNGMSNYARDGRNANAALLVNVDPDDLPGTDPLAGINLQRALEQGAYRAAQKRGGTPYSAPAQTVGAFLGGATDGAAAAGAAVEPTYPRGTVACDLREVLPAFICDTLAAALPRFDAKLHGFADPQAVMTAPESRSSSPVRIVRDGRLQAMNYCRGLRPNDPYELVPHMGIYPCGEGGGYAGGIVSAAADGMRVAAGLLEDMQTDHAVRALQTGRPVAFPTDTVVGLGVAVDFAAGPEELYRIKQRQPGKPIAWLVEGVDALYRYGVDVPDYAFELASAHWPGALTLVVRASEAVPAAYRSAEGTVALRMPASPVAFNVIAQTGCPLATTSANLSEAPAPAVTADLDDAVRTQVAAVVDSGPLARASGVASTVVDCTGAQPRILRQGDIAL